MWLRSSEAGSGGYRAFYCLCLICLWHFTTPSFLVLITQPYILLCSLESWSLPCGVPGQWHTKRQENVGVDLTVGVCVPVAEYLSSRSLLSHPPSLWFFSVNRWSRDSDLIHLIPLGKLCTFCPPSSLSVYFFSFIYSLCADHPQWETEDRQSCFLGLFFLAWLIVCDYLFWASGMFRPCLCLTTSTTMSFSLCFVRFSTQNLELILFVVLLSV